MATRHILCDQTEIILAVPLKNKYKHLNLTYEDISRIQFDACTERKLLFKTVPSEKITIMTGKHPGPVVFTRENEKKFWDEYKTNLTKFAKDNNITFADNLH